MRDVARAYGAVHDLEHIAGLDASPCQLLLVSDRTLYVLQNLAGEEVTYSARYGTEFGDGLYSPVDISDPEWQDYADTVEQLQLELMPMTCDIEAGLVAIADAISGLTCGSGDITINLPTADCLSTVDNDELTYGADLEPGTPEGGGDPPEGFDTWEEYFEYKCQAAYYVWQILRNAFTATMGLSGLQLTAAIVVPALAGVAGMLPAVFTPAGLALFVAGIVGVAALSAFALAEAYQMIEYLDDNKTDIICSLYSAGSSADAVTALATVIEDAIQYIVWPSGLAGISGALEDALGLAFSQLANNNVVEPLFKVIAGVTFPDADCDDCEEPYGCAGLKTFDTSVQGARDIVNQTSVWDGTTGHDASGSVKVTVDAGAFTSGWTGFSCSEGIVLSAGVNIGCWVYLTGHSSLAYYMQIHTSEGHTQNGPVYTTKDAWFNLHPNFDTLYGEHLDDIRIVFTNGSTTPWVIGWIDDLSVTTT